MLALIGHRRDADNLADGGMAVDDMLSEIMVGADKRFANPEAVGIGLIIERRRRIKSGVDKVALFVLVEGRQPAEPADQLGRQFAGVGSPETFERGRTAIVQPTGARGGVF